MEKASQMSEEKEAPKFIVCSASDDKEQASHVEEVEEIDFSRVTPHPNLYGSVFIERRRKPHDLEEIEDEAFRSSEKKRKARVKTRGPYRKAHVS